WLHVPVQDAALVRLCEGEEHASADGECLGQRKRPSPESLFQRDSGDERRDQEEPVILAPEVQEWGQPWTADLVQDARLVLEPLLGAGRNLAATGCLDDHLSSFGQIGPEERLDAEAVLDQPRGAEPSGEDMLN